MAKGTKRPAGSAGWRRGRPPPDTPRRILSKREGVPPDFFVFGGGNARPRSRRRQAKGRTGHCHAARFGNVHAATHTTRGWSRIPDSSIRSIDGTGTRDKIHTYSD